MPFEEATAKAKKVLKMLSKVQEGIRNVSNRYNIDRSSCYIKLILP